MKSEADAGKGQGDTMGNRKKLDVLTNSIKNSAKWHGRQPFPDPLVVPAPEEHTATLIFMHGFGADGAGRGTFIGENINLPWVKIVSAIAPIRPVPGRVNGLAQSWSSVDLLVTNELRSLIPEQATRLAESLWEAVSGQTRPNAGLDLEALLRKEVSTQGLRRIQGDTTDALRNAGHIRRLIEAETRAGIPAERVVVVGFSQGACTALSSTFLMDLRFGGLVVIAGWYPEDIVPVGDSIVGLPALFLHGDSDWLIDERLGKEASDKCRKLKMDVEYHSFTGLGHDIDAKMLKLLRRFVQERAPRTSLGLPFRRS
ncbi:Alpha/Beta hydrolase protein [Baffinella frigidus]|nr:Alpha/Beta hydrolase protein [Cryptophyta sp. CCMP2293]